MQELSPKSAWTLFVISVVLLGGLAYFANYRAERYADSEGWVAHTREVEWHLGVLRADLAVSLTGLPSRASTMTPEKQLADLKNLTSDNPEQQRNIGKLHGLLATEASSSSAAANPAVLQEQLSVLDDMQAEEERLLASRELVSSANYTWLRSILTVALLFVLGVICFIFSTLLAQLGMRAKAEKSVRRLSSHIIGAQDTERRRIARELHDGVGQLFVGIKMELDALREDAVSQPARESLENCRSMAEQGLTETRTISYLLHPPMLDELGFEHAVKWYVEGFTNRSKIEVKLKFSQPFPRLPRSVELVLFRMVQETLGNIHRHSGSKEAEISVAQQSGVVRMTVRDSGKGMPEGLLRNIEQTSTGAGVGLGGMRERVSEFDGTFSIESAPTGTAVHVSIPLPSPEQSEPNQDPRPQTKSTMDERSLKREIERGEPGGLAMAATV